MALAPPALSWQPRLKAGHGHQLFGHPGHPGHSVQRPLPLRATRLACAAPAALLIFLPRRHLRQPRAFRSRRRSSREPIAGPSLTTLEQLPLLKDVKLPTLQDLQAAAADASISAVFSKYLDHLSRGWEDLGSVTEKLRLSELKRMLPLDFKLDVSLPTSFAPDFDLTPARRLLGTAWQDDSPQAKPRMSRYWQRRGVEVAVSAAPRGYQLGLEDLDTLLQACELSRCSYCLDADGNLDMKGLTFDAELVTRVDEGNTADLSTLAWFACDCQVRGQLTRVFTIRGSWNASDWSFNLDFEPIPFEPQHCKTQHPTLAHRGFYRAAEALAQDVQLRAALADALASGRPIVFAGHSLGGSAAELLALILVLRGELPVERLSGVFTVGAAEALCARGRRFARRQGLDRKRFVNLVNLHDAVPRLTSCAYPDFVGRMVVDHDTGDLGFNPYLKLCEAFGLPKPNKDSWHRHAGFLSYSRLCEPLGLVAHVVPDGRAGIGLRVEALEHLGDVHAALDTPGLAVLLNTTQLLEFHSTDAYLKALRNARRWLQRGGPMLSARAAR